MSWPDTVVTGLAAACGEVSVRGDVGVLRTGADSFAGDLSTGRSLACFLVSICFNTGGVCLPVSPADLSCPVLTGVGGTVVLLAEDCSIV